MTEKSGKDYALEALVATGLGDVWLSADGAAILLGLIGPTGKPNRRVARDDGRQRRLGGAKR